MGQASNTIYGDIVAGETMNAMKRKLTEKAYAMNYLTDLSKYAKPGINTVNVPYITTEAGQEVAAGAAFTTPSGDGSGSEDLSLNRKAGNPFLVKRDLDKQTVVSILKEKAADAADNILKKMDVAILTGFIGEIAGAQKVNFAGASENADTITDADFIAARKFLNKKEAPLGGRFCFISPDHESQVIAIDDFVSADKIGKTTNMPIVEGFVGRVRGFDIVLLNHLPKVSNDGSISSTALENDSYPVIFGQSMAYMWAKQMSETMTEIKSLATADQYVPYNLYGHDELEADFAYMISDQTTANPT